MGREGMKPVILRGYFKKFYRTSDRENGVLAGVFHSKAGECTMNLKCGMRDAAVCDVIYVAAIRAGEYRGKPKYSGFMASRPADVDDIMALLSPLPPTKGSIARAMAEYAERVHGSAGALACVLAAAPESLYAVGATGDVLTDAADLLGVRVTAALLCARWPMMTKRLASVLELSGIKNLLGILGSNPYELLELGPVQAEPHAFQDLDRIGLDLFELDSPERLKAVASYYGPRAIAENGDTRVRMDDAAAWSGYLNSLCRRASLAPDRGHRDAMSLAVGVAASGSKHLMTAREKDGRAYCYDAGSYFCERSAAASLKSLAARGSLVWGTDDKTSAKRVMDLLDDFDRARGYEPYKADALTPEHRLAILNCIKAGAGIITGGPGRGKTTAAAALIYCWSRMREEKRGRGAPDDVVTLLAPTWKAAGRLGGAVALVNDALRRSGAGTALIDPPQAIAKMCYFEKKKQESDRSNRLDYDSGLRERRGGLAIVDETSMVDIRLFSEMLSCLKYSQVVFLGDVDQLPSIGPGQVLRDMISWGGLNTSYLTVNLRAKNAVARNADLIQEGKPFHELDWSSPNAFSMIRFDRPGTAYADTDAMQRRIVDEYAADVADVAAKQSAMDDGSTPYSEVAVICPYRGLKSGACSVEPMNLLLRDRMNPAQSYAEPDAPGTRMTADQFPGREVPFLDYAGYPFRLGDRVMCTKNFVDRGAVNGDEGFLVSYAVPEDKRYGNTNGKAGAVEVMFDSGESVAFQDDDMEALVLSYAITVHKAQGCQYDRVIYVAQARLSAIPTFGTRNMVYTALTRAKQKVRIIGFVPEIATALTRTAPERNCGFLDRLRE